VEIILNFAWAALAIFIVCSWLQIEGNGSEDRRRQIVAIAILIAILFPVISVSDDLMAAQNPAETDTCQRRDHPGDRAAHPLLDLATAIPVVQFRGAAIAAFGPSSQPIAVPTDLDCPDFTPIQNRPPPAA